MIDLVLYRTSNGIEPFTKWIEGLRSHEAESRIYKALAKMEAGNFGDAKPVGEGVHEVRIHFGPGYRIYYAYNGTEMVIILGGSDKKDQQKEIRNAKKYWTDHKKRATKSSTQKGKETQYAQRKPTHRRKIDS